MAVVAAVLFGCCLALFATKYLPIVLWHLLRLALRNPGTLWRVSAKQWWQEEATGLRFQTGCDNCDWWDRQLQSDLASRIHNAIDHVYFTGDGLRVGAHVPDRLVSCTSSAAVAIWRSSPGMMLHRIEAHSDDFLDLRYIATDAPWMFHQCRRCRLPHDGAAYCIGWGRWLQEVVLDRCSKRTYVRSVLLEKGMIPEWAVQLAIQVNSIAYRREVPTGTADWIDVWAAFQELRLSLVLRRLVH